MSRIHVFVHGIYARPPPSSPSSEPTTILPDTTTLVLAIGSKARVLPKISIRYGTNVYTNEEKNKSSPVTPIPMVYFENINDTTNSLSLTAVSLGAVTLSLPALLTSSTNDKTGVEPTMCILCNTNNSKDIYAVKLTVTKESSTTPTGSTSTSNGITIIKAAAISAPSTNPNTGSNNNGTLDIIVTNKPSTVTSPSTIVTVNNTPPLPLPTVEKKKDTTKNNEPASISSSSLSSVPNNSDTTVVPPTATNKSSSGLSATTVASSTSVKQDKGGETTLSPTTTDVTTTKILPPNNDSSSTVTKSTTAAATSQLSTTSSITPAIVRPSESISLLPNATASTNTITTSTTVEGKDIPKSSNTAVTTTNTLVAVPANSTPTNTPSSSTSSTNYNFIPPVVDTYVQSLQSKGSPLPTRLIDYFGVMVSTDVPNEDDQEEDELAAEEAAARARAHIAREFDEDDGTATDNAVSSRKDRVTSALEDEELHGHPDDSDDDGEDDTRYYNDTTATTNSSSSSAVNDSRKRTSNLSPTATSVIGKLSSRIHKRQGTLQFRRPKQDHEDLAMPDHVDWFLFPDGIVPIVQHVSEARRPSTRRSVFVLSNVGSGDTIGAKMYGVCLTAYRREDADGDGIDDGGENIASPTGNGTITNQKDIVVWWPVVLFMLTRYPIVPQLQHILEHVYNIYDAGSSSGLANKQPVTPFCSLDAYLRMLIFETPIPIRRISLSVSVFLPGPKPVPKAEGMTTVYLPPPDALPIVQFPGKNVLRMFSSAMLLRFLSALALSKRIIIIGRTVQQLTEVSESALSLIYPFSWELPYIPILPSHMASNMIQSPVPFLGGLLTSYASRILVEVDIEELADAIIVDCTTGNVDVGADLYLERRKLLRLTKDNQRKPGNKKLNQEISLVQRTIQDMQTRLMNAIQKLTSKATHSSGNDDDDGDNNDNDSNDYQYPNNVTVTTEASLRVPEPIWTDCKTELQDYFTNTASLIPSTPKNIMVDGTVGTNNSSGNSMETDYVPTNAYAADALTLRKENEPLQQIIIRFFATLLHGYRAVTFFAGVPPQFNPMVANDTLANIRGSSNNFPSVTLGLCESQAFSRMIQRHTSIYLRPFHAVSALLPSFCIPNTSTVNGTLPFPSFKDTKLWKPWLPTDGYALVVPPPGSSILAPWQSAFPYLLADRLRKNGTTVNVPEVPLPVFPALEKPKKKSKDETVRTWLSGDVAVVLGMTSWAADECELLVSLTNKKNYTGPNGDDIGGNPELHRDALIMEAAAIASEAAASSSSAGPAATVTFPITNRKKKASSSNNTPSKRRGFNLFSTRARTDTTTSATSDNDGTDEEIMQERLYNWLQICFIGNNNSSLDEKVTSMFSSPIARATFIRILQTQIMLSAGLLSPLSNAINGSKLQLQPLLGLGITNHVIHFGITLDDVTHRANMVQNIYKNLLPQALPMERFNRLANVCNIVLQECQEDRDYTTAAALLQLSYSLYTFNNPSTNRRHFLVRELGNKNLWKMLPFWEQFVVQAQAVENQQLMILRSQTGNKTGSVATVTSSASLNYVHQLCGENKYIYYLVSDIVNPALSLGLSTGDMRALASRICVKANVGLEEEKRVLNLVDMTLNASDNMANTTTPSNNSNNNGTISSTIPSVTTSNTKEPNTTSSNKEINTKGTAVVISASVPSVTSNANVPAPVPAPVAVPPTVPPATTVSKPAVTVTGNANVTTVPVAPAPAVATTKTVPVPTPAPLPVVTADTTVKSGNPTSTTTTNNNTATITSTVPPPLPPRIPTAVNTQKENSSKPSNESVVHTVSVPVPAPPVSTTNSMNPTVPPQSSLTSPPPNTQSSLPNTANLVTPSHPIHTLAGPSVTATPSTTTVTTPPTVPQHPWISLPIKEAEIAAAELVNQRKNPPAPDPAAILAASRAGPANADVSTAEIAFQAQSTGGTTESTDSKSAEGTTTASSSSAPAVPSTPATTNGSTTTASSTTKPPPSGGLFSRKKIEITKAFGGNVGLSIVASRVAAALHNVDDAVGKVLDGDVFTSTRVPGTTDSNARTLSSMLHDVAMARRNTLHYGMQTPVKGSYVMNYDNTSAVPMACLAFKGHATGASITSMSFDPVDGRVASGGNDGRVCLWDMSARTYVHAYTEHTAAVTVVRVAGDVVVSASQDGTVRVSSFARLTYGLEDTETIMSATDSSNKEEDEVATEGEVEATTSDGSIVTTSTNPSNATPARTPANTPVSLLSTPGSALKGLGNKFTNKLTTMGVPIPARLNNVERGQHKFMSAVKLKGHSGPVTALDVWERPTEENDNASTGWFNRNKDNKVKRLLPSESHYVIVTGGSDGTVRIWSADWKVNKKGKASGTALALSSNSSMHKGSSIIDSVSLSVDGRLCVSAGRDGRIGIIDIVTNKVWVMMDPNSGGGGLFSKKKETIQLDPISAPTTLPIYKASVDVTHRPIYVTSAGTDGTTRIWDLRTGQVAVAFPSGSPIWSYTSTPGHGHGAAILNADGSLASPPAPLGDNFLLSGHEDGIVRKWDSRNPLTPLHNLVGHTGAVTSLANENDMLITGSTDSTVRIWDVATGASIRCDGHFGPIASTAICSDYAVSAGWDGTLRRWYPEE